MQSFTLKIDKIIDAIWASLRLIIDPLLQLVSSGALVASCCRASARFSEQVAQGAQGLSVRDKAPGL